MDDPPIGPAPRAGEAAAGGESLLLVCLLAAAVLDVAISLTYRGRGWPLGREGWEALAAGALTLVVAGLARVGRARGRLPRGSGAEA